MNKSFIMLSGIPRSGSQVLSSMLNQHPLIYASTTSPVVDLLDIINNNWGNLSAALVNKHPDQLGNIIKGMIDGAYKHVDKSVIIDKNRIWPKYGKLLEQSFGQKPKIICTVRPIPEVLASYILLIEKNNNKITYIDQDLIQSNLPINTKNRCKILWEKYISVPYTTLRAGYNSGNIDLCIEDYNSIVNDSQSVMNRICNFIGIRSIDINTASLQPMDENDEYHGGLNGLHNVRSTMARTSPPAAEVIGKDLVKLYTDMHLDFWSR